MAKILLLIISLSDDTLGLLCGNISPPGLMKNTIDAFLDVEKNVHGISIKSFDVYQSAANILIFKYKNLNFATVWCSSSHHPWICRLIALIVTPTAKHETVDIQPFSKFILSRYAVTNSLSGEIMIAQQEIMKAKKPKISIFSHNLPQLWLRQQNMKQLTFNLFPNSSSAKKEIMNAKMPNNM